MHKSGRFVATKDGFTVVALEAKQDSITLKIPKDSTCDVLKTSQVDEPIKERQS